MHRPRRKASIVNGKVASVHRFARFRHRGLILKEERVACPRQPRSGSASDAFRLGRVNCHPICLVSGGSGLVETECRNGFTGARGHIDVFSVRTECDADGPLESLRAIDAVLHFIHECEAA